MQGESSWAECSKPIAIRLKRCMNAKGNQPSVEVHRLPDCIPVLGTGNGLPLEV
jgi:hypothetical protein